MCATHALQLEGADDVGGQLLRVCQCHTHDAVGLCAAQRPVLVALDPGPLLQPRQHDNCAAALLPHHPPKVGKSLRQGTLEKRGKYFVIPVHLINTRKFIQKYVT